MLSRNDSNFSILQSISTMKCSIITEPYPWCGDWLPVVWKTNSSSISNKGGCGWFGMIFENIQSDLLKEVRGQSWPWRLLQKHVKMTSKYILVDGLGWYLRIFNLTCLKRSEAKVDLRGHFKNMSKWLQITYLWIVWDDIWEYSIWPT